MHSKYALIGNNVQSSPSPKMHNKTFGKFGLDCTYEIMEIQNIGKNETTLRNLSGFNVTIPFKERIIDILDGLDGQTKGIGAVNTVVNNEGNLIGHNTDWEAAIKSLTSRFSVTDKRIAILGSGGASRALVYGLQNECDVNVFFRNYEKAKKIKDDFKCTIKEIDKIDGPWDIIINATPVTQECIIPKDTIKGSFFFDLSYKKTKMLLTAKDLGCQTLDGREMLARQAAKSFEIWTGKKVDFEFMLRFID